MKPDTQLSCEVVRADLPLFVGGDLHLDGEQGPAARALRLHLDECPECREELESLRGAREAFLSLGADSGAPGLWPDVRAVLAAEGRFETAPTTAAPVYRFRQLAAAALLAGIGLFFWFGGSETPIAPEAPAPVGLALEEKVAPATPSPVSPLRPLLPGELAFSEDAALFGEDPGAQVTTPPAGQGRVSVAGHKLIR